MLEGNFPTEHTSNQEVRGGKLLELENRVKSAINKSKNLINKFKVDKWSSIFYFELTISLIHFLVVRNEIIKHNNNYCCKGSGKEGDNMNDAANIWILMLKFIKEISMRIECFMKLEDSYSLLHENKADLWT